MLLLDRRPVLAGVLFALLAYKPHFGLVLPVALLAGRRWIAIASATATLALMTLASLLAFGTGTWLAFRASLPFTRTVVLEAGNTGWEKIQSAFAAARALGAGVGTAYAIQGALTGLVVLALAWIWHGEADRRLKAAALIIAALLSTPYVLDYDMVVLGPALAFAVSYALDHGFRPWEKSLLAFVFVVPILTRAIAAATLVPLGLIAMVAFFALVISVARGRAPPPAH